MLPQPNFPVRPDEFVGRRQQVEIFRQSLQQGLQTGRTASFAVLGDWGIGKSSLLLKFATLCTQPPFEMLPVFLSASSDIRDYLRLAEIRLDKYADALLAVPKMQARLRTKLLDWRFRRINFGSVGLDSESPRLFLSSGSSLLRHSFKEAWDHFLRPARLNRAIFFLDDLENITSISKEDLALMIRDQFQAFGIEVMNYSVCFSGSPTILPEQRPWPTQQSGFTRNSIWSLSRSKRHWNTYAQCSACRSTVSEKVAAWLQEKTRGHPYFIASIYKYLMATAKQIQPHKLETYWPAILDQLGREKFRADIAQLSAKELGLAQQFASFSESDIPAHHLTGKIHREHCAAPR